MGTAVEHVWQQLAPRFQDIYEQPFFLVYIYFTFTIFSPHVSYPLLA